jgi:hypothetical protein
LKTLPGRQDSLQSIDYREVTSKVLISLRLCLTQPQDDHENSALIFIVAIQGEIPCNGPTALSVRKIIGYECRNRQALLTRKKRRDESRR